MGGIKILSDGSRHRIEKKLSELKDQRDKGFITTEEYDTLRIRYERKLGNTEEVSRIQKLKGFEPKQSMKSRSEKDELFDEFVDQPNNEEKVYKEMVKEPSVNSTTKFLLLAIFVILAFIIGIGAGAVVLGDASNQTNVVNTTVSESAFSTGNATIQNATLVANNTTVGTNGTTGTTTYTITKKSTTSTGSSYSSGSKSSTTSSSSSSSKKSSTSDSSSSSGSSSSTSSSSSGSGSTSSN